MTAYLSVQVQTFGPLAQAFLDTARPKIVKWLDWSDSGISGLRWLHNLVPDLVVVGRYVAPDGWSWSAHYQETLRLHAALGPLVDLWELANEPASDLDGVRALCEFTLFVALHAPADFRSVIGNFSRGCPAATSEADQAGLVAWQAFYPAMRAAKQRGWWLGIHEYGAPTMDGDVPWLCGRFPALVWPELPDDLREMEVLIGECGLEQPGWQSLTTAEGYTAQLQRYLALWGRVRCRGACVFLLGASPGGGWERFDVAGCLPLADAMRAQVVPETPGEEDPKVLKGIDVSSNNGHIDWPAVAASGVRFAVVKASEGCGYVNPQFCQDRRDAHAAGLQVGCYHYARPDQTSAQAEAEQFLSAVGRLEPGEFLALDLETGDGDLLGWALTWLRAVERAVGFKPLLYSGLWFMQPHNLVGSAELAEYGLWLAAWGTTPPAPAPPWPFVAIWQHSSTGTVPGIQGQVDLDQFNGTAEQLARYGAPADGVPAEWRQYGSTWPMVASTLKGVADDALSRGRQMKALAEQQVTLWGSR